MTTNEVNTATFLFIEALLSTAYFLYDFRLCCKEKIQNEIQNPLTPSFPQREKEANGLIFFEIWNIKIRTELKEETHVYRIRVPYLRCRHPS